MYHIWKKFYYRQVFTVGLAILAWSWFEYIATAVGTVIGWLCLVLNRFANIFKETYDWIDHFICLPWLIEISDWNCHCLDDYGTKCYVVASYSLGICIVLGGFAIKVPPTCSELHYIMYTNCSLEIHFVRRSLYYCLKKLVFPL